MKNDLKKVIKDFGDIKFIKLVERLNTPKKIQDWLDSVPINFEEDGETYLSPIKVFELNKAHCFEGACFALVCLTYHKRVAFLLDLKAMKQDQDHTVLLFKEKSGWGAISKTNHPVLRWRDPIYKNSGEVALSYFHEYFLKDGTKSLVSFSSPFDVFKIFGTGWAVGNDELDEIAERLDKSPHTLFINKKDRGLLRKAS